LHIHRYLPEPAADQSQSLAMLAAVDYTAPIIHFFNGMQRQAFETVLPKSSSAAIQLQLPSLPLKLL
jgi:hypothetical protein